MPISTPVVSCGWLAQPTNGLKEGISYLVGSKIYFHCNNGYSLAGAETSTCLADGTWSSPTPTCQSGEDTQSTRPGLLQASRPAHPTPPTFLPLPQPAPPTGPALA